MIDRPAEIAAQLRDVAGPPPRDPITDPPDAVSAWNIANALTCVRLLLVPVFAVFLAAGSDSHNGWRIAAFVVFVLAAITDRIDGELARRRQLVTELGKLLDPLADKALTGTALVELSLLHDLPWWVTVVILVRELGVTGLRFWVLRHGVLAASRGGKVKTFLQTVAIALFVLPLSGWLEVVAGVVMGAALILTVVTGVDYVVRAIRLRRVGRARQSRAAKQAKQAERA